MNKDNEENVQILEESDAIVTHNLQENQMTESNGHLDDIVEEASEIFRIEHMRCAVHTLQLAIRDGLKNQHAATLIGKLIVRQVAVASRTPKIDAILKRRAGKRIILDQAIRWGEHLFDD